MKRFGRKILVVGIVATVLTGAWCRHYLIPSEKNTISILTDRQSEFTDFIAMARSEAVQPHGDLQTMRPGLSELLRPQSTHFASIYEDLDGRLVGRVLDWDLFEMDTVAVGTELQDTWTALRQGRLTGVQCDVTESGALRARFFRQGNWIRNDEGNYRSSYCLIFQDEHYPEPPLGYWRLLTEEDGVAVSVGGNWYIAHEKQYDG